MKSFRSIAVTATVIALLVLHTALLNSPALASEPSAQAEHTTSQPTLICKLIKNKPAFCREAHL